MESNPLLPPTKRGGNLSNYVDDNSPASPSSLPDDVGDIINEEDDAELDRLERERDTGVVQPDFVVTTRPEPSSATPLNRGYNSNSQKAGDTPMQGGGLSLGLGSSPRTSGIYEERDEKTQSSEQLKHHLQSRSHSYNNNNNNLSVGTNGIQGPSPSSSSPMLIQTTYDAFVSTLSVSYDCTIEPFFTTIEDLRSHFLKRKDSNKDAAKRLSNAETLLRALHARCNPATNGKVADQSNPNSINSSSKLVSLNGEPMSIDSDVRQFVKSKKNVTGTTSSMWSDDDLLVLGIIPNVVVVNSNNNISNAQHASSSSSKKLSETDITGRQSSGSNSPMAGPSSSSEAAQHQKDATTTPTSSPAKSSNNNNGHHSSSFHPSGILNTMDSAKRNSGMNIRNENNNLIGELPNTGSMSTNASFSQANETGEGRMRPIDVLGNAIDGVAPGHCIVIFYHQPPAPVKLVEELARVKGAKIELMDCGITIHRRPRFDEAYKKMKDAIDNGYWLVLTNATKSVATLNYLHDLLNQEGGDNDNSSSNKSKKEKKTITVKNNNIDEEVDEVAEDTTAAPAVAAAPIDGFVSEGNQQQGAGSPSHLASRKARVIIIGEPHPHFPKKLLGPGNKVYRISDFRDTANESRETLRDSMIRLKKLKSSQAAMSNSQMNMSSELPKARKVRISSNLDVFDCEESAAGGTSIASTAGGPGSNFLVEETSVGEDEGHPYQSEPVPEVVFSQCQGLPGESFMCLEPAGDGRIAAGSSGGNIHLFTTKGQRLLTFKAHHCHVFAADFRGHNQILSGSEDTSLSLWARDPLYRRPGYVGRVLTTFTNNVMAARFVDPLRTDVAAAGGLNGTLCLVNVITGARKAIRTSSQILCLSRVLSRSNTILMGAGNGLVTVWDCEKGAAVDSFCHHKVKVTKVTAHQGSLISTSFDGSVTISDLRARAISSRLSPFGRPSEVTAFAAMDNILAVAARESLFIYDLRKPPQLVYKKPVAWSGFCNGILLDNSEGYPIATTASSDGIIRFYGCR